MDEILKDSLNSWLTSAVEQELYSRFRWHADYLDKIHLDVSFIENEGWLVYRYTSTSSSTMNVEKADMLLISLKDGVIRQVGYTASAVEAEKLINSSEGRSLGKIRALENISSKAYGEDLLLAGIYVQIPENNVDHIVYGENILRNVGVPSFLPYSVAEGERVSLGVKSSQEIWVLSLIPEGCVDALSWNVSNLRQPHWRVQGSNKWTIPTAPTTSMMKLSSLMYSDLSFTKMLENAKVQSFDNGDFSTLIWSEVSYSIGQDDYRWNRMGHLDRMLVSADRYFGQCL